MDELQITKETTCHINRYLKLINIDIGQMAVDKGAAGMGRK